MGIQYLIMHGSYGSPKENWFPWLKDKLVGEGNKVILEQFPVDNWDEVEKIGYEKIATYQAKESLQTWEKYFVDGILPQIQKSKTVFIGHSIAPIFMLHMLSKYNFTLEKAIFVSPFFNIPDRPEIWQFYPVNKTFYSYDFDFNRIIKRIGKSYVVCGDDDPYVPATESPLFADKIGGEIHVIPGGRHCGSNFKEFPLVYNLVT